MQRQPRPKGTHRPRRSRRFSRWYLLLWIPVLVALFPPLFNRAEPTLMGLPFYYWGQLAFAVACSALTVVVHVATKGR